MTYNKDVKTTKVHSDVIRLVRFAAILWLGYLIALAIINQAFRPPPPPYPLQAPQRTDSLYYILHASIALLCLGLAYWSWIQERLKQAFIPLIITIITVMPLIANWLTLRLFPFNPRFGPEDPTLRSLPFLFTGLLLVAWQYKWPYILLVILGITGLNLGVVWSSTPPDRPLFPGGLIVPLIQTVVFLSVSFSISYLMSRLRKQQQSLETANIRLTHYASTLEQLATTKERNRLARELHDTLAHTLSGLSVQLETIKAYWDVDHQAARSVLDKSLEATHSGLEETRRALKALRASPLDDLGLARAISSLVEDAAARANLSLELPEIIMLPALSPDVEQCIYRIAQEAVTNVVKHANAKKLTVKLESIEGKVTLTVSDDGVGFDVEKSNKSSHFGVTGMRERARSVGSELNVISKAGHGTTIQLTI